MIVEIKQNKKEKDFPKLMISQRGVIVLFTDKNTGICLYDGSNTVRGISSSWDIAAFQDFKGEITIKND